MPHLFVRHNRHVLNANIHILESVSVFFICIFWHQSQTLMITLTLKHVLKSSRLRDLSLRKAKTERERERVGEGGRRERREKEGKAMCGCFVISHTFLETFCHVYFQHSSHANLLN